MAIGTVKPVDSSMDGCIERAAKVVLTTPTAGDREARSTRIALDELVEPANAGGLFRVRFGRPRTSLATSRRAESLPERSEPARVGLSRARVGSAIRRHCSGCARDTEHVLWPSRQPAGIDSIRWPAAEPAADSTICRDCGQLRVAAFRPTPPAWSNWPRAPRQPAAANEGARRNIWRERKKEYVEIRSRTRSNRDSNRREGTRGERQWSSIRTSPSGTAKI
jgi:hypothetical protein